MAIDVASVWEIRSGGTATGGGGFVTGGGGTDRTQQDAVHATRTDLVIGSAGSEDELTSAADAFAADDVGNFVNVTAGTGFTPGRYEILSQAAGVATMDRNVGTADSTGGSGVLGGAMTFIDANMDDIIAGNTFHIQSDATHTPGATVAPANAGTSANMVKGFGYNTTRQDQPLKADMPLIAMAANILLFPALWQIHNVRVTTTEADGMKGGNNCQFVQCSAFNSSGTSNRSAFELALISQVIDGEGESTNGAACRIGNSAKTRGNYFHDSVNGVIGTFTSIAGGSHLFNIFDRCSTAGLNFGSGTTQTVQYNTFYKCGDAVTASTAPLALVENNNFVDNTVAIDWSSGHLDSNRFDWNNFNINGTDVTNAADVGLNDTAAAPGFTAPDEVSAADRNFAVGTNLKATGTPNIFMGSSTVGFTDQNAAQREEPAGGAGGGMKLVGDGGLAG